MMIPSKPLFTRRCEGAKKRIHVCFASAALLLWALVDRQHGIMVGGFTHHQYKQQHARPQLQRPASFHLSLFGTPKEELVTTSSRLEKKKKKDSFTSQENQSKVNQKKRPKIVLVAGLNRSINLNIDPTVFADSDIRTGNTSLTDPNDLGINPLFRTAIQEADAFIGSLIFDYDSNKLESHFRVHFQILE